MRGLEGRAIRMVSMCGPCNHEGGLESVAAQHGNCINTHNTDPSDPRQFFWKSLGDQPEEWLDDGEEIVPLGNFDEEVNNQISSVNST